MKDEIFSAFTAALGKADGIVGVVLGGSRGRGTNTAFSDYDIGLYYNRQNPLDIAGLQAAIEPFIDDPAATLTSIGEWGPWINCGGWFTIAGTKVDLLYRELDRVADVIADARQGQFTMNYQVGHPHGFCSVILMGEIATCQILHDRNGQTARVKALATSYPELLMNNLIVRFGWEVGFAIDNARLAARRGEQNHVAGCAYRALACLAQVIFALNRRYLINEKGALFESSQYPKTIDLLAERQGEVWAMIGANALDEAVLALEGLRQDMNKLPSAGL